MACCYPIAVPAQSLLEKKISIRASREALSTVLERMERDGDFYFSYNSDVLPADSLVSVSASGEAVREVLDRLLGPDLEYAETGKYIILRPARLRLALVFGDITNRRNTYVVSGFVTNARTGERVPDASVYERQLLLSTLTDTRGRFRLRVRDRYKTAALTASKALYADTTMFIQLEAVTVSPTGGNGRQGTAGPYGEAEDSGEVERTGLGRFLVSSRQRIQSLNLRDFFVESPVQASLTPGLSSQGSLSTQMVNKVSVNLVGGYTAGVDGIEMGGIFNINKKSVRHIQLAGGINLVGGSARGIQAAGLYNLVLDTVSGVQMAGAYNRVMGGPVSGFQAAGIYNRVRGNVSGVQMAGAFNNLTGAFNGFQAAGIGNIVHQDMRGVQIGGFNYAKTLKGMQIGLVNIADSSSGYSIGLLNIVRKSGYRKLSLFASETFPVNLAFKSGTSRLYAILQAGVKPGPRKLYAGGLGFGKEILYDHGFSLQPEITVLSVYQGSDHTNLLNTWNIRLNYAPGKNIRFFAGPSINLWYSKQDNPVTGYGFIPADRKHDFRIGRGSLRGWLGWSAGISIF